MYSDDEIKCPYCITEPRSTAWWLSKGEELLREMMDARTAAKQQGLAGPVFSQYIDERVAIWLHRTFETNVAPEVAAAVTATTPRMFAIGSPEWNGVGKLDEEAGEVVQVIGKLVATGGKVEHWDGSNLRQRLIEECGDVLAAAEFVALTNGFQEEVAERRHMKLKLFLKWNREQVPLPEQKESDEQ